MNHQHYPGGMIPSLSDSSMKRRRGRPRKEESLAQAGKSLALVSPVLVIRPSNEVPNFIPPLQPQVDLSKGKARVEDISSNGVVVKEDEMIGQVVTGVLEGMFDAGYFLSVRVGESDTQLRGIVFQPGKFVPVTEENDIAPSAKMYSRIDVPGQGSKSPAQAHGTTNTSSKSVENVSVNNNHHRPVEPVCFTLFPPTLEKDEGECAENGSAKGKAVDSKADKECDPIALEPERIIVEESSHVPMGCEGSIVKEGPVYDNRANEDVAKDVEDQGLDLQAEKHSDQVMIEEPSEVFMECEGFDGKEGAGEDMVMRSCGYEDDVEKEVQSEKAANGVEEVIVPLDTNGAVEQKHEGSSEARNSCERVGSPYLELSLSNSTFSIEIPVDLSKLTEEKKLQSNEVERSISLQILDPLASSAEEKASKISVDAYEGHKSHDADDPAEGIKEEHAPLSFPSSLSLENNSSDDVSLQPLAKKPKIDETMESMDAGASDPFLSPAAIMLSTPKELVGSQGFKDPSCELKPIEADPSCELKPLEAE